MRLPVVPQISTKDGLSNKNARLTNCLKEVKKSGEKAVVRPGLVLSNTYTGLGNGLIPFDGRLLVIYDDTITDTGDDTLPWPLDSGEWSAGTTYDFGDTVWYGGSLWFSFLNGNIGNTPGGGSWGRQPTDTSYDPAASYSVGDTVLYGGVTYYSLVPSNTGNPPTSSPLQWSTTPTTTARYTSSISGYGGADPGPECATEAAAQNARCLTTTLYGSCATRNLGSGVFFTWSDNYVIGAQGYVKRWLAAGTLPCVNPSTDIGYVGLGTIVQTHV
jgi:hypothetical protein